MSKVVRGVVKTYAAIENGVVKGYKAVENATVGAYKSVEDTAVNMGKSFKKEYDRIKGEEAKREAERAASEGSASEE